MAVFEGMKTLAEVVHEVNNPESEFKTVVIDLAGELYRLILEEEAKGATRPTLNQYGDTGSNIERFCRALCRAPVNAVFVCHDHPVKDEGAGEVIQLPWTGTGNPKLGRQLLGMVDVIAFTGVIEQSEGGREFVGQLTTNKGRPGGDRFNVLAGDTSYRRLDLSEWIDTIVAAEAQDHVEADASVVESTDNETEKE